MQLSNEARALADTRRRFMTHFAGLGLGATLAPGVLWARMQDAGAQRVTLEMVTDALKLAGIEATEAERQAMVNGANQALTRYEAIRQDRHPQRRLAAVSLQRRRAGHRRQQDEAARSA